jgi:hypothetical protein
MKHLIRKPTHRLPQSAGELLFLPNENGVFRRTAVSNNKRMKMKTIILVVTIFLNFNLFSDTTLVEKVVKVEKTDEKPTDKKKDNPNPYILALFAAFAGSLLPKVYELFRRNSLKGKVISQYSNLVDVNQGVIFQKISIFSKNSDFYPKNIEIYTKLPDTDEVECTNMVWRNLIFTFDGVQKTLQIDKDKYIQHQTVFPKNQSISGYISFKVEPLRDIQFEYIRYVFEDFNGNKKEMRCTTVDLNSNTQLYDDNIWV